LRKGYTLAESTAETSSSAYPTMHNQAKKASLGDKSFDNPLRNAVVFAPLVYQDCH
jgi:hypothetical protein